jgi:hypothetical protein
VTSRQLAARLGRSEADTKAGRAIASSLWASRPRAYSDVVAYDERATCGKDESRQRDDDHRSTSGRCRNARKGAVLQVTLRRLLWTTSRRTRGQCSLSTEPVAARCLLLHRSRSDERLDPAPAGTCDSSVATVWVAFEEAPVFCKGGAARGADGLAGCGRTTSRRPGRGPGRLGELRRCAERDGGLRRRLRPRARRRRRARSTRLAPPGRVGGIPLP